MIACHVHRKGMHLGPGVAGAKAMSCGFGAWPIISKCTCSLAWPHPSQVWPRETNPSAKINIVVCWLNIVDVFFGTKMLIS